MNNVIEMTRIERRQDIDGHQYWCVMLFSATTAKWLIMSEHLSNAAALTDLQNWR